MKRAAVVLIAVLVLAVGVFKLSKARTFQLFGEIVPRVETRQRVVALTFDDGPAPNVSEVLDTLADRKVKATFFLIGSNIESDPDDAKRIVAAGHQVGNHTWSHDRMIFKSPSFIAREIEETDRLIRAAGYRGEIDFRAVLQEARGTAALSRAASPARYHVGRRAGDRSGDRRAYRPDRGGRARARPARLDHPAASDVQAAHRDAGGDRADHRRIARAWVYVCHGQSASRHAIMNDEHPINFARAMPNWQPLVEYRRNGVAENTIHGAVSWVSGRNLIYSFGGNVEVYGRSMVKPLMMKVFAKDFARALNPEQQAISVASHNGDTEHVRVARSILRQSEWGTHADAARRAARAVRASGAPPAPLVPLLLRRARRDSARLQAEAAGSASATSCRIIRSSSSTWPTCSASSAATGSRARSRRTAADCRR